MTKRTLSRLSYENSLLIRHDASAKLLGDLSKATGISKRTLINHLGLSRSHANRKQQTHHPVSSDDSERILGMQALIAQVQAMVAIENQAADFDAAKWLAWWISEPLPAIGGKTPVTYMNTIEGMNFVSRLLATIESGSYI